MTAADLAIIALKKLWWIPLPFLVMKGVVVFCKKWGKIRNKI